MKTNGFCGKEVKTTPGVHYTGACSRACTVAAQSMNHLWGMRQNEPLFRVSFWTAGGGGGGVGGRTAVGCRACDCSPAGTDLWPVCLTFHPPRLNLEKLKDSNAGQTDAAYISIQPPTAR